MSKTDNSEMKLGLWLHSVTNTKRKEETHIFSFSRLRSLAVWLPAQLLSEFTFYGGLFSCSINLTGLFGILIRQLRCIWTLFQWTEETVSAKQRRPAELFFRPLSFTRCLSGISTETKNSITHMLRYWGWLDCVKVRGRIKSRGQNLIFY